MCGRFTLRTPLHKVLTQLGLEFANQVQARYNIAPSQTIVTVRQGRVGKEFAFMKWGFLPAWAVDPSSAMINARSETAAAKPTFRGAFRERRCLLPADGFYEWKKVGRKKEPYFIHLSDERPFAFAGLWEKWKGTDTCAILTTVANPLLRPLHERMPVILDRDDHEKWLNPASDTEELQAILLPYPSERMSFRPVSTRVNNAASDDPSCLEPPAPEKFLF